MHGSPQHGAFTFQVKVPPGRISHEVYKSTRVTGRPITCLDTFKKPQHSGNGTGYVSSGSAVNSYLCTERFRLGIFNGNEKKIWNVLDKMLGYLFFIFI